ncbi:hypothetical protein NBRC116600_11370 [Thalassotalea sp. SU-HH00458]
MLYIIKHLHKIAIMFYIIKKNERNFHFFCFILRKLITLNKNNYGGNDEYFRKNSE